MEDLENATHQNQLEEEDYITFSLDARQRGVGNGVDAVEREINGFIIKKCAVDPQTYAFSYSLRPYAPDKGSLQSVARTRIPFVSEPLIRRNPNGYVYMESFQENSQVFYTIDGSTPTTSTYQYDKPVLSPQECEISAISVVPGIGKSLINRVRFDQLVVNRPDISPKNIYFYQSVDVTIGSTTEEANIYYTLDGTEPDVNAVEYNSPIKIKNKTILKAKAFKDGYKSSETSQARYEPYEPKSGVHYKYFEGKEKRIRSGITSVPIRTGTVDQISYREIETNKTAYSLQFLASINIETEGEYTFYTGSNDGSMLYIDNKLVVNNGGDHGYLEESGKIYLTKGKHFIEVGYFQVGGGQDLFVFYEGPGIPKQEIPAKVFK
jgi:hypothetical protein